MSNQGDPFPVCKQACTEGTNGSCKTWSDPYGCGGCCGCLGCMQTALALAAYQPKPKPQGAN